jgi:hypothetical protein
MRFLPQLRDSGLQRLIDGEESCFELLAFIDVVIRAAEHSARTEIDLALACQPMQLAIGPFNPEFDVKATAAHRRFQCTADL